MKKNVGFNFKKRLRSGEPVIGQMIGPRNDPDETVRALQRIGYDFICIDNEHSLVGKETIFEYIRAARELEMPILMRPEEKTDNFRPYLDAGINGLMVSGIEMVEEALFAVNQAYFPPIGRRGMGVNMSPHLLDGQNANDMTLFEITEYVNNNAMVFTIVESEAGVGELHRILRLEGVTGISVGPNDFVLSMHRFPPKVRREELFTSEAVETRFTQIIDTCREAGKPAGMGALTPQGFVKWAKQGFRMFFLGYVIDNNAESLKPRVEELKALLKSL
jgi:4-hydroxy-2-oxoheptanedioate aldolase